MHASSPSDGPGRDFEQSHLFRAGDPRIKSIDNMQNAKIPFLSYHDAIRNCIENNPNGYCLEKKEPSDPPAEWASDIHYRLVEKFALEDWSNVAIYSALGTAADRYHGIDAFVRFTDPKTKRVTDITIDFTVNPAKMEGGYKADLIINSTGVFANEKYAIKGGFEDFPDIDHATKEEDRAIEGKRRDKIVTMIIEILASKISQERPQANQQQSLSGMHRHWRRSNRRNLHNEHAQ